MSVAAMTAALPQEARSSRIGSSRRLRRGLFLSGNIGLLMGVFLGFLRAYPDVLARWLPFHVTDTGLALAGMTLAGLFVGATAGLALRGSKGLIRSGVGMFVLIAALLVSEEVRALGLRLSLGAALVGENPAVLAEQIGLGLVGVLVGIRTGHVAIRPTGQPSPSPTPHRARRATSSRGSQRRTQASQESRASAAAVPDSNRGRGIQIVKPRPYPKPTWRKRRFRRGVQLGREKTNVCPYCLEEVKPRDPRGRVVCKICGTPHHADCWAITGKCEVPHLQT